MDQAAEPVAAQDPDTCDRLRLSFQERLPGGLDLALEDGDLVAQGQDVRGLGPVGAGEKSKQSERLRPGKVDNS